MDKITTVTLLVCLTMGITGAATPRSSVDNPIYNFGEVLKGSLVIHTFTLTNVGDETLTINRVRTSCGCTTTTLSNTSLAPGESVGLEAVFDTWGYGGRVLKSIFVETNDPDTPRLTLRLTGVVKEPEPYHIAVGDLNYLFYLLIDLREPEDYAVGHLMGAINIPYAELAG